MLEILAIIFLCKKNSENAKARGKKGGVATFYTILLWFGCEVIGAAIFFMIFDEHMFVAAYALTLLSAVVGGVISYFIAKSGNVVVQNQVQQFPQPGMPMNAPYPIQQPYPQPGMPYDASYQYQQPQQPYPQPGMPQNAPYPNQQQFQQPGIPLSAPYPVQQPYPQPGMPENTFYQHQQSQPQPMYAQQTNVTQCPFCSGPIAPGNQNCSYCGRSVAEM